VGQRIARILARKYGTLDALREATRESLERIPDIGPEIAGSVTDFFDQEENQKVLQHLANVGVEVREMAAPSRERDLEGKTFVFTGRLESFTREEAKEKVETLGGRASSSVSKETDFVVAGEQPGSKLDEAKKLNLEILDEKGFKSLIGK
jgi:DNA ligase (NAD+)